MHTLSPVKKAGSMVSCACSQMPVRIDGYTDVETESWLPAGLYDVLEDHFGFYSDGSYQVSATPQNLYSFFEVFEIDMALTLMNCGLRTVKEATQFLDWTGYGWLANYSNADSVRFACKHGIDVNDFIDVFFSHKNYAKTADRNLSDALNFLSDFETYKSRTALACMIASGEVKLAHVREVGYDLINECVDSELLHKALKRVSDSADEGETLVYTSADLNAMLAKCRGRQDMLRRLKIMDSYDIRTATSAKHLGFLSNYSWSRISLSAECFLYADDLFGVLRATSVEEQVGQLISTELVKGLCEAKVDLEFAAPLILKGEKVERITAMSAGVHTSMTEGWL